MSRCQKLLENQEQILRISERLLNEAGIKKPTDKKEIPTPTLPLPKNDTGTKEGLAIYFATQPVSDIDAAVEKIKEKSNTKLKFSTKGMKKENYDGNPTAYDNTIAAINFLNTQVISDSGTKKLLLNALSSGKHLSQTLAGGSGLAPNSIDRGDSVFGGIKEHAMGLVRDLNVNITLGESDKWCPADFFIYGSGVSLSTIKKAQTLNVADGSINSFFMDTFTSPDAGKILAVSLKEEKAQAGKATSFLSVLEKEKNYPKVKPDETQSKFTALAYLFKVIRVGEDIGYVSEAISVIQKNESVLEKVAGAEKLKSLEKSLKEQLSISLAGKDGKPLNIKQLGIVQNTKGVFDKKLTRDYVSKMKIEKKFSMISKLKTSIDLFNATILNYANKRYTAAKKEFKKVLSQNNFNEPTEKKTLDTTNTELLLKKAGCYDVASKVLNGVGDGKKLNIPTAFKNIILEKQNVFLAVVAYAISQGGISPTFFKLVGNESGDGAHVKHFPSDGILSLQKGTDVEIVDSGTFAGFEVEFKAQILQGKKLIDKYKVTLGFQYAGDQFKIEVTELKG